MVIKRALEEGNRLNHNYVGTEHLLLGLMQTGRGVAADVLVHNQAAFSGSDR